MKSLVIVESPTKAKTIRKFLPKDYLVDSSMGHIRDLPASAKEIPAKHKGESWARLGINVDDDFKPLYVVSSDKKKVVKRLKDQLKEVDQLILATDEDREGEGISWHLLEVLKPKVPVKRMVFHEITKEAILHALENPREVDQRLVNAQETRRIIDRLAGYTISPLLWKKIAPGLSAGRVQSVAVEFIVQRERERMRFKKGAYYDLSAELENTSKQDFTAALANLNGKRLANGKDFDENTGKLKKPDTVVLLDENSSEALVKDLEKATWTVSSVEKKQKKRHPAPPFTTSTLQQEANRKFGYSAKDTMRIAQHLYENGLITYMRTDSTNLSNQAISAARACVQDTYGDKYLFNSVRTYGKAKGAQEAHEAIRPAGSNFKKPEETALSGREFKLYDLIWKRTIATQMADAVLEFTNAELLASTENNKATFKSSGKTIVFPGFFRAYVEGSDDPEAALENQENPLPELKENDAVNCTALKKQGHETKPPARYTEATLVKELEARGIGRPSTYATIISTVQDRGYVNLEGKAMVPSFTAFAVTTLLEDHFPDLVNSEFTSEMEAHLDEIALGDRHPIQYLKDYYSGKKGLKNQVDSREDDIDPQKAKTIELPLEDLGEIELHIGRFGPYAELHKGEEVIRTSLPESLFPCDVTTAKLEELIRQNEEGPQPIGKDPVTGFNVFVLTGRYGPYVQLGTAEDLNNEKPKRASLLKGMQVEDVDLKTALDLLSLPRELGTHPETGKVIKAGVGRFGPYVVHEKTFASLTKDDDVITIGLERALELIAKKAASKKPSTALKELGEHPKDKKPVQVMDGRYGPYIKHGRTNASLPKGTKPEDVTIEMAVKLLDEKKSSSKKKK